MFKIFGYVPAVYNCAPCMNAKRLLDARAIPYEFVSVADAKTDSGKPIIKNEVLDEIQKLSGSRPLSMPQIFHDGKHIGGFDQLREYVRSL